MAKHKFHTRVNRIMESVKLPTASTGFVNQDLWVSSGNYAMNRRWSGEFDKAFLFGRNYAFYGESGSAKSLFAATTAANAQKEHGAYVVWIDVEHATDGKTGQEWFQRAGVDTSEDSFLYVSAATLEEIKTIIAKITKDYRESYSEDMPPLVFVVDSWAAAVTESEWERIGGKEAGKLVGDMGQKAKQLGDVIKSVTHLCARLPVLTIGILHIMDNQDMYGRKHKLTGGHKVLYYASGAMLLTKKELQLRDIDDDEKREELFGHVLADVKNKMGGDRYTVGIISSMEIIKSRVTKPFERVDIAIPYDTGIDPYSGLFEVLMQEGMIRKGSPGWFEYVEPTGEVVKFRRKDFLSHADHLMEIAGSILEDQDEPVETAVVEVVEDEE
ncbi:MAG: hypothetical protein D6698_04070 [Gammaproteobacteria bacterium]|nr:MAG: hypothetical protein D6698_04070 [Gammaproteobacteria bacterium]